MICTLAPCLTMKARPSRRPRKKLVRSPATAHAQTTAIIVRTSTWPWPATRPPSSSAVSPGRDEADEGAGLEEGQRADEQVGPVPEPLADVDQQLLEVRELDDAEAVDERGHGDEGAAGEQRGLQPAPAPDEEGDAARRRRRARRASQHRPPRGDGDRARLALGRAAPRRRARRAGRRRGRSPSGPSRRRARGRRRPRGAVASASSIAGHSARAAGSRSLTISSSGRSAAARRHLAQPGREVGRVARQALAVGLAVDVGGRRARRATGARARRRAPAAGSGVRRSPAPVAR